MKPNCIYRYEAPLRLAESGDECSRLIAQASKLEPGPGRLRISTILKERNRRSLRRQQLMVGGIAVAIALLILTGSKHSPLEGEGFIPIGSAAQSTVEEPLSAVEGSLSDVMQPLPETVVAPPLPPSMTDAAEHKPSPGVSDAPSIALQRPKRVVVLHPKSSGPPSPDSKLREERKPRDEYAEFGGRK